MQWIRCKFTSRQLAALWRIQMSAAMTKKVTEYHDRLAQAIRNLRGQEVTQSRIREAYTDEFPDSTEDLQWIMAADHCRDHTNRGPCRCSCTENALFERLGRNRYRVR